MTSTIWEATDFSDHTILTAPLEWHPDHTLGLNPEILAIKTLLDAVLSNTLARSEPTRTLRLAATLRMTPTKAHRTLNSILSYNNRR